MTPILAEPSQRKPIKKQGSKSQQRENSAKRPKSKQGKKEYSILASGHRQSS
jgi:hypothetical protein